MISIIILALIGVFTLIGIIVGAIKGFTRVKSWGVELILSGVLSIALSRLFGKSGGGIASAILSIGVTVALICIFMLLFAVFRKLLNKRIEKRKQISYYQQYDEIEDNTEQILCALNTEDKKKYNKLTKRKFKQSGGVWSVLDRVFGAIVLAFKGVVMAGIFASFLLVIADISNLASEGGALYGFVGNAYQNKSWEFFKPYFFDFLIIGILTMCIKSGYARGITSSLWSLVVLGLVVGAGVLAFSRAFNGSEFATAAENFGEKLSSGFLSGVIGMLEGVGITADTIAKIIIGLILFVLLLVVVIIIAVFVPRLIDRARDSVVFRSIDGVFGAIILTVFILAVLLLVGAVVNSMHDCEFMTGFNSYFGKSGIATYIYDKNLLNSMGILSDLPLKDWFS